MATATKAKKVKKTEPRRKPAAKPAARRKAKDNVDRQPLGKYAAAEAAAFAGKLPEPPDFSAETHRGYRPQLAELIALVKAGNLAKLHDVQIKGDSTSPRAMKRYQILASIALKAKGKKSF